MSLQDFWVSVRTAARMIAPTVTADSPRINIGDIERILRGAVIWLTPKSVAGFNERDFDFLSDAERTQLSESVHQFIAVARHVGPREAASESQIQQALPHFLRIVEILGGNRFADPEAFVLGKRIEQQTAGRVPESVLELRFETGEDSSGGEGLWVWVVLKDEIAEDQEILLFNANEIREMLKDAVRELGIKRWPYVRFRTNSDLEPLQPQRARQ